MSPPPGAPDASAESRVGTVVADRYKILAQLGEGGIGTVFLAEDTALRMRVALKLLKRELSEEKEVVLRFEREANAMTQLAHDHIVQALNFGRTREGDICMVMELVEGETLRTALKRLKPVAVPLVVEMARQLSLALTRAHELGVVHRDLKPENVMVAWRGEEPFLKVLDFGMARILGATFGPQSPLTRKGSVFGTPEYMPPEQAMGRPVDARADQYAFGVMLFEMLGGKRPFRADNALDMLQLQIHAAPPYLPELVPTVPAAVDAVVRKMLAKKPDERFPDVASAYAALESAAFPQRASTGPRAQAASGEQAGEAGEGSEAGEGKGGRKWWQIFGGKKG